ncbi:MAG: DUF916 domain-containing protein [Acidimicrobiia bacterium]
MLPALVVAALLGPLAAAPAQAAGSSPSPSPSPSTSASRPAGTGNVTFGIGPSTKRKIDRRAGFTILTPAGGVLRDEVAVVNLTSSPLTLNLYAADAVNGADGTLGLQPASAPLADASAWVRFGAPGDKGYVVVPPRGAVYVPFTVTVPKTAFVGDHLAGIVASTVSTGQAPGERGTDVTFEQRIGVRLGVRVAGVLEPRLVVENVSATYSGTLNPVGRGTAVVTYTVRNTGNVRLGGRQSVVVSGLVGPTAASAPLPDVPLLLPGGSATVSVPVDDVLPLGLMTATVTVDALAPVSDANPPSAQAVGTATFWAVPWILLAILLLLALGLALWLRARRSVPPPTGRRAAGSAPPQPELVDA